MNMSVGDAFLSLFALSVSLRLMLMALIITAMGVAFLEYHDQIDHTDYRVPEVNYLQYERY
ncbi:MAG: hypothetical protein AAF228_11755 [Pseudomonadota bacterium]